MISFCEDKKEIISLWSAVFNDSEEDILYFIDNLQHGKCLAYYIDDKVVSMFFLVDCKIESENAKYIYAACTFKEFEGRGYMTELIEYASDYENNPICLIPANESLIKFYSDRGFNRIADISSLIFNEKEVINEYLFEGFELEEPIVMVKE